MKELLVVVDMQKDFIDGSLGTKEAQAIVEPVCEKIRSFNGDVIYTRDTHGENYLDTLEGKNQRKNTLCYRQACFRQCRTDGNCFYRQI